MSSSIPLLKKYFLSLLISYRHGFRTYQRWLLQCKQVRGMCENCCQCAFVFFIFSSAGHNSFLSFFRSQINYFNMFTLFNWLHFFSLFASLRSIFSVSIILYTSLIFRHLRFIFCRSVHLMLLVLYVALMGWQTVFQISVTRVAGLFKPRNFPFDFTSLVSYKRMYVRMRSRSTGKIKSEELS